MYACFMNQFYNMFVALVFRLNSKNNINLIPARKVGTAYITSQISYLIAKGFYALIFCLLVYSLVNNMVDYHHIL